MAERDPTINVCPVCLADPGFSPWADDSASHEICPSCGIQFGYNDARPELRMYVYEAWRNAWLAGGRRPISGEDWQTISHRVIVLAQGMVAAGAATAPTRVVVDGALLTDWPAFHRAFADGFGFPTFYGANMNAWVDCMTSLDQPSDDMTLVHAAPGGVVTLCVDNIDQFARAAPEILEALRDAVAFVNFRRLEVGEPPVLAVAFHKTERIVDHSAG